MFLNPIKLCYLCGFMVFGVDMFYEELLIIKPDFHTQKYPATSGLEQLRQQTLTVVP